MAALSCWRGCGPPGHAPQSDAAEAILELDRGSDSGRCVLRLTAAPGQKVAQEAWFDIFSGAHSISINTTHNAKVDDSETINIETMGMPKTITCGYTHM